MKVYVDASVVLRRTFNQPGAIEDWSQWELVVTSEVLSVEVFRKVDRLRLAGRLTDDQVADRLALLHALTARFLKIPIQSAILRRAASPFPTALGTLDAIHLATALLWVEQNEEPLTLLTHDDALALAARACGLHVLP